MLPTWDVFDFLPHGRCLFPIFSRHEMFVISCLMTDVCFMYFPAWDVSKFFPHGRCLFSSFFFFPAWNILISCLIADVCFMYFRHEIFIIFYAFWPMFSSCFPAWDGCSFFYFPFALCSGMTVLKGSLIPSRITEAQNCHPLSHLLSLPFLFFLLVAPFQAL